MSLRDAVISPSHFISSRGVDEEFVRALHGYLDLGVPCIKSLNGFNCRYLSGGARSRHNGVLYLKENDAATKGAYAALAVRM
jgi:hypothetical protein